MKQSGRTLRAVYKEGADCLAPRQTVRFVGCGAWEGFEERTWCVGPLR